uniref:C2H2-type domain-containing protein n=1 Tax=Octopus bimaculoides TaxID=37653 RepID=A0A0L8H510_OCTBM
MNIKWNGNVTDDSVLEGTRSSNSRITAIILKHRLRWAGHVAKMKETRLRHQILYSELSTGRRLRGHPTVDTNHFEAERQRKEKKQERKWRLKQPKPPPRIPCKLCNRRFHGKIGLISHQRHKHGQTGRSQINYRTHDKTPPPPMMICSHYYMYYKAYYSTTGI